MTRAPEPSVRRSRAGIVALALVAFALSAVAPAGASAAPPLLRQFCDGGAGLAGAGQCNIPRGVAVDPESGHAFVADSSNDRIQEFTAWGAFVKAWGWGVLDGSEELQTCATSCLAGIKGGGRGQLTRPQGIAIGAEGDVYVAEGDFNNRRVQRFDPGEEASEPVQFVVMFGGEVNKTKVEGAAPEAEQNVCPVDPGDACQASSEGAGNGQFGSWVAGSYIAPSPDGETIYVGDQERVQEFDSGGNYLGELPDPGGVLAGETVQSLAVGPAGSLYAAFSESEDVLKLNSAGEELCVLEAGDPDAVATDSEGGVWVADQGPHAPGFFQPPAFHRFNSACEETEEPFGKGEFDASTGIAASTACGIEGVDLFIANSRHANSFVRLYGPQPDTEICPPPEVPPTIKGQHALSVDTGSAVVGAEINPHFWVDTSYWVQYGIADCKTSPEACEEKALFPGAQLGAGPIDAFKASPGVVLDGLEPDTTYFYRFVAESSGGGPVFGEGEEEAGGSFRTYPRPESRADACPNEALRSGLSAALPDCRAYEMVSPLDKNNGDVLTRGGFNVASTDGRRLTFSSLTAFAEAESAPSTSQYLSSRDPDEGWLTAAISPPRDSVSFFPAGAATNEIQFKAFSEDLCDGWLLQDNRVALVPGAPADLPNLYRRDLCGESGYELLTTVAPPPPFGFSTESFYYLNVGGFSADAGRSAFYAPAALTPDACQTPPEVTVTSGGAPLVAGIQQLYIAYGGGKLRLLSVRPDGTASCSNSSIGTSLATSYFGKDNVLHAVSEDGTRVFWTDTGSKNTSGGSGEGPGKLYLRINAVEAQSQVSGGKCTQPALACTIALSEDSSTRFWGADPEGKRAIYTTGPISATAKLHAFDVEEEEDELIAEEVIGVLGASEDARRVYFVSTEALGGGQNSEGAEASEGRPNLYLHEHEGGLAFVATLADADVQNSPLGVGLPSSVANAVDLRTSRVSPDGLHAAFLSAAPLTGYDNTDLNSGQADAEVYLYDRAGGGAGELVCASCNPSGARPQGVNLAGGSLVYWGAAKIPGWRSQTHPGSALSATGDRLFFESFDALVLGDTNGSKDVYQWEAPGSGDCTTESAHYFEANQGCLSLIGSGQSPGDSIFIDATPSGSDVFIATEASLLPQDYGLADVYDARVDGGFPPPPASPPACEGEACQAPPAAPDDPTPASATFEGAGNVVAAGSDAAPCARAGRKAKHARNRARRLIRNSKRVGANNPRRAVAMRRTARRLAGRAKKLSKRAKRCRARANRRAAK
ncbi:MAG TPA: hypothetical protein VFT19_12865 [Solirubrobacterales bacterium]|nr:hypothetical protein [Solirubrobacterales bacterium]